MAQSDAMGIIPLPAFFILIYSAMYPRPIGNIYIYNTFTQNKNYNKKLQGDFCGLTGAKLLFCAKFKGRLFNSHLYRSSFVI